MRPPCATLTFDYGKDELRFTEPTDTEDVDQGHEDTENRCVGSLVALAVVPKGENKGCRSNLSRNRDEVGCATC